jgi:hypothetical protein
LVVSGSGTLAISSSATTSLSQSAAQAAGYNYFCNNLTMSLYVNGSLQLLELYRWCQGETQTTYSSL